METPILEFSRPVKVSEMGKAGLEFPAEANAEELAALTKRLDVRAVNELTAQIRVQHWRKGGAHLKAQIKGSMTRNCVVSLENFEQPFEGTVDILYADPRDKIHKPQMSDSELILEAEGDDPPDVLENDHFDAGEAIAQYLVLHLDPYPRKPGAEFKDMVENDEESSPFSVLSGLKIVSDKDGEKG